MSRKQLALFEPTLVVQALKEAVKKLNPQAQWLKRRTKSAKAFQIKYENSNFRASIETVVLCMSVSFTFICLKNIHIISDIKIFS